MDLNYHLTEITRLRREADSLPEDNPIGLMSKIDLLAKCMTFVGRLSSHLDGEYKRSYNLRKRMYALAEKDAKPPKQSNAELAIIEYRDAEADAYEMMHRWRNAYESTQEEIHALKLRMRIDFADGNNANHRT